ncbi:MAG: alpha,alpha-phosphotrehalase [Clostridiales bacterium]|nr:alpha,alpha-phosphotrehalase [Clostridiales bacterium]
MGNFKNKTIYQIYVRSFKDSNGDGIGDIRGIIEKLNYLRRLGVDYLWLTPIFTSPQNDNGYDVADYLNVDPLFGNMADLEELIQKAGEKGIGIMLDMVFNHTSTKHEWFKRAMAGEEEFLNYYIFKGGSPDTPPTNWKSKFGGPAWAYVENLNKYYLHLFDETQADLNWGNPAVRENLKNVIRFWKQKGIKGFRFDVINLISKPEVFEMDFEGDGRRFYTDGPLVHEYIKELVRDTGIIDMVTVGEMSSTSLENCIKYSNPAEEELSMCFNFHHLKIDYKDQDKWQVIPPDIEKLKGLFEAWQIGMQKTDGWNALFWCNHDQPRIVSRLGDDKAYRVVSAKMLATSIHLMRGTPYIYQGEELGMTNAYFTDISQYQDIESHNYYKIMLSQGKSSSEALKIIGLRSRDNSRTPMQWSDEEYAGFSKNKPWISLLDNYKSINAENGLNDDNSIFAYYQKLIRLRKEKAVISEGGIEFILPNTKNLLAYRRYLGPEEIIALNNFSNKEIIIGQDFKGYKAILGNYESPLNGGQTLRAFEAVVLEKQ